MISRLIGLTYENIAKMANKIVNVLNHLKVVLNHNSSDMIKMFFERQKSLALNYVHKCQKKKDLRFMILLKKRVTLAFI